MESRPLKLHITEGPREGEEVEFKPGSRIRIGRAVRGNNVAIKDTGISSKHLSIELDTKSRRWILQDLGSSNGTFINGFPTALSPKTPYTIHDGDSIIGEFTSILCKLDCAAAGESELPRNPPPRRRRAAARKNLEEGAATGVLKESEEKLGSKEAEDECMEAGVLESVASTSMKDVENIGSEKEKTGQVRVSPKRTRGRKRKEEEGSGASSVIETKCEEKNNPGKRTESGMKRKM